jgi:hypothetical protein
MGPGGSLGAVYSTLMGWATYIYFLGCGFFRIVSKHFKIDPSKLTLFGIFKWVVLIRLIC